MLRNGCLYVCLMLFFFLNRTQNNTSVRIKQRAFVNVVCYLDKLIIIITQEKTKPLNFCGSFLFDLLIIFFKTFVCKTRKKFVNKENYTIVKIASTRSSNIYLSYQLGKCCRHRSINWGSGDAGNYPTTQPPAAFV